MKEISTSKLTEQKSIFYAHLFSIDSLDDIDEIFKILKKKYKKANHICYGIYFKNDSYEKFKNDREVGEPGRLLLNLLKEYYLGNHVFAVARVFGGIKLGQGGVQRAFKKVGENCLKDSD